MSHFLLSYLIIAIDELRCLFRSAEQLLCRMHIDDPTNDYLESAHFAIVNLTKVVTDTHQIVSNETLSQG